MASKNITRRDALGLAVGGIAALGGGILASTFHGDEAQKHKMSSAPGT